MILNVSVLCPYRKYFWRLQKGCSVSLVDWTPLSLFSEAVPCSRWGFSEALEGLAAPPCDSPTPTPDFKTLLGKPFFVHPRTQLQVRTCRSPGPGSWAWPYKYFPSKLASTAWVLEAQAAMALVSLEPLHSGRGSTPREKLLGGLWQQRAVGIHSVCRSSAPVFSFY